MVASLTRESFLPKPQNSRDIRALFADLVAQTPEVRAVRVREIELRDAPLAHDLAALLKAHVASESFLESPLVEEAPTCDDTSEEQTHRDTFADPLGQVVSHYRLEERLGAGGMGVVYRARDIALGREAALKLLPGQSTPDLQQRLRGEAVACAKLQHPAIATFFESGESRGRAYIAMEFVPGRTLRRRLAEGSLAVDEAVSIAGGMLTALNHAHACGVLHRDIKPENIIITPGGAVKLLDFGIATLLANADDRTLEQHAAGSIVGTVGYMSPEQIRNESLDARSDLFPVAAVLYEMLTGVPAFGGRTAAERLAAILVQDPPRIERAGVGDPLQQVIRRALSRDPARRFPTAAAFLSALQDATDGQALALLSASIAVVDFENLGDTADNWIGSGMADSLAEDLGQIPDVRLVPRQRVMSIAAPAGDVEAVALTRGIAVAARWVLAGTYRRLGPALRVNVLLIETSTNAVLMREPHDGTVEHIFALQDRIGASVRARIASDAASALRHAARPRLSAYEAHAKARRLAASNDRGALQGARELFNAAIEAEPSYARAMSGLARVLALTYTFTNDSASLHAAIRSAERAIACDGRLAEAYVWRGYAYFRLGLHDQSKESIATARALDPADVYAHYFVAGPKWTENPVDVREHLQRAVTLDPKFGAAWWSLGSLCVAIARHDEAISCFERCGQLLEVADARPFPGVHGYWAECLRQLGRLPDARHKALECLEVIERSDYMYRDSNRVFALVTLGRIALDQRDEGAATAAFDQAIEHLNGRPKTLAGGTLLVRAQAGLAAARRDPALYESACRRMTERGDLDYTWLWLCDDYITWAMLADVAHLLELGNEAHDFRARALAAGPRPQH